MYRATIDQSYPSSALQEAVLATIDKLNSCGLKAKPGISHHFETAVAGQQPDENRSMNVLDDDCLLAIFERLPLPDLASVADVSHRFRQIARKCFNLAKPVVRISENDLIRKNEDYECSVDEFEHKIFRRASQILRNFGSLVVGIEIEHFRSIFRSKKFEEKLVQLLIDHCAKPLVELKLLLNEMKNLPIEMRPIMQNLRKLEYGNDNIIDPSIFSWLTEIEDLSIPYTTRRQQKASDALMRHSFRNLKRISLDELTLRSRNLAVFMENNQRLKEIEIGSISMLDTHPSELFTSHSSSVEKICLADDSEDSFRYIAASSFRHLKHLQSLSLTTNWIMPTTTFNFTVEPFIREIIGADIQLKHLTLSSFPLCDEDLQLRDAVSKLKHLETLTLLKPKWKSVKGINRLSSELRTLNELRLSMDENRTVVRMDEIKELAKCFPNLQNLMLYRFNMDRMIVYTFGSKDFIEIVAIVEQRPKKTPLHIVLTDRCYGIDIPIELEQRHRHILTVTPPPQ